MLQVSRGLENQLLRAGTLPLLSEEKCRDSTSMGGREPAYK